MIGSHKQITPYLRRLRSVFGIAEHSQGIVKGGGVARLKGNVNMLSEESGENQMFGEANPWAACGV